MKIDDEDEKVYPEKSYPYEMKKVIYLLIQVNDKYSAKRRIIKYNKRLFNNIFE